jgi:hypothetical protein
MLTDDNEAIIKESKMAELWMQVYDFTQNPLHFAKRIEGHFGGQDYKIVIEEGKQEVTLRLFEKVKNDKDP